MMETVEVPFPAVICVLSQATTVPIPGLRAIMQAGKKPQNELSLSGLGFTGENLSRKTEIVENKGYVMNRKNVIFKDGDNQELVDAFLDSLVKEGVL
jgi:electron transfer flavoprotein beta subunit